MYLQYAKPCRIFLYSTFILDELRVFAEEIILLEPKGYGGESCVGLFYCEYSKDPSK